MTGFGANAIRQVTIRIQAIPPVITNQRKYKNPFVYAKLKLQWMHDIHYSLEHWQASWLRSMALAGRKMHIEVVFKHSHLFDVDNSYTALKPCLDALVKLGYLKDDRPEFLDVHVTQEKINLKETIFTVTEAQ